MNTCRYWTAECGDRDGYCLNDEHGSCPTKAQDVHYEEVGRMIKRERVDPKCEGCPRIYVDFEGNEFCTTYLVTSHWWRHDKKCPFHPSVLENKKVEEKKKMGWKRSRNE